MDQDSGRRRSSRLAAKGIVTTPRAEFVTKKSVKSVEKPKRSKRKTTVEAVELPDSKKTKIEDNESSDEVISEQLQANNVKNDVSAVKPTNVENPETKVSLPSDVEQNDEPIDDDETDVPIQDSKEQVIEKIPVADEDTEKVVSPLKSDNEKQSDIIEEPIKNKESEVVEEQNSDASQEELVVSQEKSNGNDDHQSDDQEIIETVNESVKDGDFSVATKDVVTSNGDANIKPNGDELIPELDAEEPKKVLCDETNHVESEIKAVTTNVIATSNIDVSKIDQLDKEMEKIIDSSVDNITVSPDDNGSNGDNSSTVVS